MHAMPSLTSTLRALALLPLLFAACGDDTTYITTPTDPDLGTDDPLPGVVIAIESVEGGSQPSGNAQPGDRLAITFTLRDDAGNALDLANFAAGQAIVSGPTFDYQRVIGAETDVVARSVALGGGRYRFAFAQPVPSTYLPPLDDTSSITAGERTGEALLGGAYTVGLSLRAEYAIDGTTYADLGSTTRDFLLGSATQLTARAVVDSQNCAQCHGELSAHGLFRGDVTQCLLCHTAGAEDRSGLGRSVDFRVMIHKIHAGKTLPSVQGVTTDANGVRDYTATPVPYQLLGETLHDWSDAHFPVWPSMSIGMPRDTEYGSIGSTAQQKENVMLTGPVACASCHGDPDGSGPLGAPAQGTLIEGQLTRAACASCHDDWIPERPYVANGQPMPPQLEDGSCIVCHDPSSATLGVAGAHTHPLTDATFATGIDVAITAVADEGGDADGAFDAGEFVRVDFTVSDGAGNPIAPASLARIEAVLGGPSENPNLLQLIRIPTSTVGAGPSLSTRLPEQLALEHVGASTAALESFTTARQNHRNATGALTYVFVETASGASTTLAVAAREGQNVLDLTDASAFAAGDVLRIDTGADREWAQVRRIDGNRAFLSSRNNPTYGSGSAARPITSGLRRAHALGATATKATLTEIPSSSWSLTTTTGTIAESVEFGTGEVLVSYTTDYVVPATFPGALNESPDLDESHGDWTGLPVVDGTYLLRLTATRSLSKNVLGTTTSYTEASQATSATMLFGNASTVLIPARIDNVSACAKCHTDLQFHGGSRRGIDGCFGCHSLAGAEDAPRYVYPSAAATDETTIDFRGMLHSIHHGVNLDAGASYEVVGFGGTSTTYEHIAYPRTPGGTKDCASCHGESNTSWRIPASRTHQAGTVEARVWRAACTSCHDSSAARSHVDSNTSVSGVESCAVCHGEDDPASVLRTHRVR